MNPSYLTQVYLARLSFKDAYGLEAVFDCYQRLRVLAPELEYVVHHIWGDGDQINRYVCPGAEPAQVARINGRDVVISKLKRPARRGDEIELYSTRRIHHAFKDDRRFFWEYSPITPTQRARVAIDFPVGREPEAVSIGASRGSRSPHVLRPATKSLITTVDDPTLRSVYRMSWAW